MNHENGSITLSKHHLVYVKNRQGWVCAAKLKVGDVLECTRENQFKFGESKVVSVDANTIQIPKMSIVTESGELVVSGLRISSYAHSNKLHYLTKLLPLRRRCPKVFAQMEKMAISYFRAMG